MPLRALILGASMLAFGSSTEAQSLPHSRALFADSVSVPPFPHQAEVDSLIARFAQAADEAYADGGSHVRPPEPQVEFSAVLDNGREVTLTEYFALLRSEWSDGPLCFVSVTVQWSGVISSARVVTCRYGNIADEVLIAAVRRLRAEVVDYGLGGFPMQWSFAFPPPRR